MMSEPLRDLILRYRRAEGIGQESPAKLAALETIQASDDAEATEFLATVAADPGEYDLARTEALRALEVRAMGRQERELVAGVLNKLMRDDEDPDVRIYAARTLAGVMDLPIARQTVEKHLLDPEEDEDVRHNAFFALERGGDSQWAVGVLMKCLGDSSFQTGARRLLAKWGKGE